MSGCINVFMYTSSGKEFQMAPVIILQKVPEIFLEMVCDTRHARNVACRTVNRFVRNMNGCVGDVNGFVHCRDRICLVLIIYRKILVMC